MLKLDIKGAKNKYRTPVDCRTIEQTAFDERQVKTITNYYRQKQTEHLEYEHEPKQQLQDRRSGYIEYIQ